MDSAISHLGPALASTGLQASTPSPILCTQESAWAFQKCHSGYVIPLLKTLLPIFLWIKVKHGTHPCLCLNVCLAWHSLSIISKLISCYAPIIPAKLQPQWTLTSQMFFSTSRLLYILVPLVFSQIFKGTASFHPLSLSLNFTYSGRPSLSTLARAAPILVFPHSHCPLPHISYYLLFSLSIAYWCVLSTFISLINAVCSLLCP